MYQNRSEVSMRIPIPRKGTKYVARQRGSLKNSVPVVVAIRDMLKLARTTKEVKKMIHEKALKINGKEVKDHRESINLLNILQADKSYLLTFLTTGRFVLEEHKEKERTCKVIGKKILSGKKVQLNLHDGSNVISDKKITVQDTVYLDFSGKLTKHVVIEKGKSCIIISGKYIGRKGKIESAENGNVTVKMKDIESPHTLEKQRVIAL